MTDRKQLFEELKNRIVVKYDLDTEKYDAAVRSELLSDHDEKRRLYDEPEIQRLLKQLVELDPDTGRIVKEGTHTYEELEWKVLEAAIHALVHESEGLGMPEE